MATRGVTLRRHRSFPRWSMPHGRRRGSPASGGGGSRWRPKKGGHSPPLPPPHPLLPPNLALLKVDSRCDRDGQIHTTHGRIRGPPVGICAWERTRDDHAWARWRWLRRALVQAGRRRQWPSQWEATVVQVQGHGVAAQWAVGCADLRAHHRVWLAMFTGEAEAARACNIAVRRFQGHDAITNFRGPLSCFGSSRPTARISHRTGAPSPWHPRRPRRCHPWGPRRTSTSSSRR